jgi:hypothetical protein
MKSVSRAHIWEENNPGREVRDILMVERFLQAEQVERNAKSSLAGGSSTPRRPQQIDDPGAAQEKVHASHNIATLAALRSAKDNPKDQKHLILDKPLPPLPPLLPLQAATPPAPRSERQPSSAPPLQSFVPKKTRQALKQGITITRCGSR